MAIVKFQLLPCQCGYDRYDASFLVSYCLPSIISKAGYNIYKAFFSHQKAGQHPFSCQVPDELCESSPGTLEKGPLPQLIKMDEKWDGCWLINFQLQPFRYQIIMLFSFSRYRTSIAEFVDIEDYRYKL